MISANTSDLQTDVLVIGGGGSGLPAAMAAMEAGAKVILIDKRKMLGGTAIMAMGMFAVESPAQKRLGITHTADECFTEHMDLSNWTCDAKLVRNWLDGSKDVVRWLETKGIDFDNVQAFTGIKNFYHQVANQPSMTGKTIVDMLAKECQEKGVVILMETRAQRLLTDTKGSVVGVLANQNDKELKITAKSVIIATGSISGNNELLKRYYPEVSFDNVMIMAAVPHNTGDGLYLAQEVGAAKDASISTLFIGPHNHPHNARVGLLVRRPHMMLVNRLGERYSDESLFCRHQWGWFAGMALDRQPGRMCYTLMDHKILQDMI
jgi:succinate dehydrogenase/fumarate reductase flavoprotein subunit